MTDAAVPQRAKMNGKQVFSIPASTIINFKSGFVHKLLCDGPTFSSGTACNFSCSFCYVPAVMAKQLPTLAKHGVTGKHEDIVIRRKNAVDIVRRQLTDTKGRPRFGDHSDRRVIYASPLVDVAGNMELVRETVEICKVILELTHWHIRLLSKSNLLPKVAAMLDDYFSTDGRCSPVEKIYPKNRVIYGVSTGTLDDGLAKAFEQGTPLVSKRIESLHWLQDNGYRTFGMVCPSLPQKHYREFAESMAAAIRYEKCERVWAEVINTRGESFTRTHKALSDAGYHDEAEMLRCVSTDPEAKFWWEKYAQATFMAHTEFCPPEKLRFLQYINNGNRDWWTVQVQRGAVLL